MKISRRKAIFGWAAVAVAAAGAALVIGPGGNVLSPGKSRARPIQTDAKPPREADVVVIGGGNNGAAIAYFLAKAGQKVVLCEKGAIGGEASGRSVGHILSLGAAKVKMPIINDAKSLWRGLNAELGIETGFRENGLFMEIKGEEEREFWLGWIKEMGDLAPQAHVLDRAEVAQRLPLKSPWFGAIFDPTEGSAEPKLVSPAFAEAARRLGASIVAPCAVRGVETTGGAVSGVVTEHGPIKTRNVILAGGSWTERFLHNMGMRLPLGSVFQWCASFHGVSGPPENGIFNNTTWRRQIDGGFTTALRDVNAPITPASFRYLPEMLGMLTTGAEGWAVRPRLSSYFFKELAEPGTWKLDEVSPFERRRILEPEIDQNYVNRMFSQMRTVMPSFADLRVSDAWGGVISSLPDLMPVLGPLPGVPGMVLAVGMPEGLTTAPAVGKFLADLMGGSSVPYDLKAFAFDRFGG